MSFRGKMILRLMKKTLNMNKPLEALRDDFRAFEGSFTPKKTTAVEKNLVEGIPCQWTIPEGCSTDRCILLLHGGGYCLGAYGVGESHGIHLAEMMNMTTILVDYPLAPEAPFPAAIHAVYDVYKSLMQNREILLWGQSSGCGLALNLMIHLREQGLPQPKGAVLLTPFLDATMSGESQTTMRDVDPYFVEKPFVVADYYTKGLDTTDPMVSPIFHDVSGLAEMLIHVAELDTLADDGRMLYDKVKAANGKVTYTFWKSMWHSFHMNDNIVPEAKKALSECRVFIERVIGS